MTDDMWTPYKHLYKVVDSFLSSKTNETSISNLDYKLRKHKQNFLNLLRNPVSTKTEQYKKIQLLIK